MKDLKIIHYISLGTLLFDSIFIAFFLSHELSYKVWEFWLILFILLCPILVFIASSYLIIKLRKLQHIKVIYSFFIISISISYFLLFSYFNHLTKGTVKYSSLGMAIVSNTNILYKFITVYLFHIILVIFCIFTFFLCSWKYGKFRDIKG